MRKSKQPIRYFVGLHVTHGVWVVLESKSGKAVRAPDYAVVDGPFLNLEQANHEARDRNATERGFGSQQVFDVLMGMISNDPSVSLSSDILPVAASQAIVGLGKDANFHDKVVTMLVAELRRSDYVTHGSAWHVIMMLDEILGEDAVELAEDEQGVLPAIREAYLAWGDLNGY